MEKEIHDLKYDIYYMQRQFREENFDEKLLM